MMERYKGDWGSIALLLLLYTLQGVPMVWAVQVDLYHVLPAR